MAAIRDAFFSTPLSKFIVFGVYTLLCLIYMTCGINHSTKLLKMVLKCSPILFLIAFFIYTVSSLHIGPVQAVGEIGNLERVIFALIFSCLGDCYLVFDSFFIHGLLSFSCAHLIYISLFGGRMLVFIMPTLYSELITAAAVGLVSLLVYFYILARLGRVLVVPAAMYCVLISVMLWCALVTLQQDPQLSTLQGAIGAGLFYTSDLLLSLNRWGKGPIPYGNYLIIATYYAAQVFIFLSVINKF